MGDTTTTDNVSRELVRVDDLLVTYAQAVEQSPETVMDLLNRTPRDGQIGAEHSAPTDETVATGFEDRERTASTLGGIVDQFELTRTQADALSLTLAPDLDGVYERVYGLLQGDRSMRRPTVGLVIAVLRAAGQERLDVMGALSPTEALVEWDLLDLVERGVDTPFRSRIITADQRVLAHLFDSDGTESVADDRLRRIDPSSWSGGLHLPPQSRDRLDGAIQDGRRQTLYVFSGPAGAGRRRAARAVCAERETPLIRVDAHDLADDVGLLDRAVREARLQAAALQVTGIEAVTDRSSESSAASGPDVAAVLDAVETVRQNVFLSGDAAVTVSRDLAHSVVNLDFPRPGYERRRAVWEAHASAVPEAVDLSELAATFALTQGQIEDAITVARNSGRTDQITRSALYEGCKSQSSSRLEELAQRLEPSATWADIVLPGDTESHLREVASRVTNRGSVYGEWGLGEQFTRGTGVVALFAGPSGTGKTMAAEVIATDAGLDLYKVDLSTVVSKYIGETEENLEAIFDAAENSSSILLFDEADAIFGERSSGSDSTDRYANVEVNYLLQRIERYDGVVLLTTNFDQHIDDAFQRRIDLTVDFSRPDADAREQIWREMFAGSTPTEEIDYSFLGGLALTGGSIKNAVQSAAFLAAADDSPITMAHVLPAVKREFDKTGQLLGPDDLGDYRTEFAG